MQKDFPIIFFGTPDFAVPSLQSMINAGYYIPVVVTVPDKPAGRGLELKRSEIGEFADKHHIPVLNPENLEDLQFVNTLLEYKPALMVVVAFRKLPEVVWKLPAFGTINLHASLLPHYRGAAPINWAIINGEKETGVTTFFISDKIDTGDIIMQHKIEISENETAGSLHDLLAERGADLLVRTISAIRDGKFPRKEQYRITEIKKAPKLTKEGCRINWDTELTRLYNFVRGLSPYPAAWTTLNGRKLKVFSTEKIDVNHSIKLKSVETDYKSFMHIAVKGGFLSVSELQIEGRSRLGIREFLRGIPMGQHLIIE
jgi:methionyl-tRNA formyltransferase